MALIRVNGSIELINVNETDLFAAQVDLKHYATHVYLNNLVDGPPFSDVTIRVYVFDNEIATERLYDSQQFKGVQSDPDIYIPFIPVEGGYRVSAQRASSSNIIITFDRLEAT